MKSREQVFRSKPVLPVPLALVLFFCLLAISVIAIMALPGRVEIAATGPARLEAPVSEILGRTDAVAASIAPIRYPFLFQESSVRPERIRRNLARIQTIAMRMMQDSTAPADLEGFAEKLRAFDTDVRRHLETLAELSLKSELTNNQAGLTVGIVEQALQRADATRARLVEALTASGTEKSAAEETGVVARKLADADRTLASLRDIATAFGRLKLVDSREALDGIKSGVTSSLGSLVGVFAKPQSTESRFIMTSVVPRVVGALNDPDRAFAHADAAIRLNRRAGQQADRIGGQAVEIAAAARDVLARAAARRVATDAGASGRDRDFAASPGYIVIGLAMVGMLLVIGVVLSGRRRREPADREPELGVGSAFSEILDSVPQAFVIWKPNGALASFNKKYAELRPEMIPFLDANPTLQDYAEKAFAMFKPDATPEEISENRNWALSESLDDEIQVSDEKWFQRSIRKTASGWTVFVLNDISAQKLVQQSLEDKSAELEGTNQRLANAQKETSLFRRRLEEAIETTPNGFALWDGEDNLLFINRRYLELRPEMAPYVDGNPGYEDFSRNSVRTRMPDATDEEVEEVLQASIAKYESGENTGVFQAPSGNWIQIDIRRTDEGGYVAVYSDITELYEARAQLAAAIENMQNGFILWGADDRIVLVNERAREMLPDRVDLLVPGTPLREFAERSARLRRPEATDDEIAEAVKSMVAGRRKKLDPVEIQETQGQWHLVHINPLENGEAVTVLADITEQKAIQARLEAQAEDLQRSNRELEQFAYLASHDLQEPLRVVGSYCELLERRYADKLDDDGREFIAYAVDGAHRMRSLIDDLLIYSRTGRGKLSKEPFELAVAVDHARQSLRTLIEENDAEIEVGELPRIVGNETMISQVFQNLIGNAIKFRSEQAPRIRVTAERVKGDWVVSVSDNGIGISEEYAERVFRIFQRLHRRQDIPGNGLGLALCQRIVARHGGRIWSKTGIDNGATIEFSIPVAPVAAGPGIDREPDFAREQGTSE